MDALGFTTNDLDANRSGYMTAGQEELLKVGRLEAGAKYALIALLFCVILIAGLLSLSSGNQNTIYVVMGFGIFGLIAIGVIVVAVMEWRNFTLDIREGQASMVTGPFTLAALKAGRDSTHYKIKIHDLVFDISESA